MAGDYGWLQPMPPGQQRHGFFIDDENRILFWPGRDAPGFILNEAIARSVLRLRGLGVNSGPMELAVVALVLGAGQALGYWLYPWLHGLFSDAGLSLGVSVLLFVALVPGLLWWRKRLIARALAGAPTIAEPRPPVQVLKPSTLMPKRFVFWPMLLACGAIAAAFLSVGLFEDSAIGDRLVFGALGAGLVALVALLASWEIKGLRLDQIRYYEPRNPPPPAPPHPSPSRWKVAATTMLMIAGGIGLGWGYAAFTTRGLTADAIEAAYLDAVARPGGEGAVKWAGPVPIYVSVSKEARVHDRIVDRMGEVGRLSGLTMVPMEVPPQRGVTILFIDGPRMKDGRHDAASGGYWADASGHLVWARTEISPVSLFSSAGEGAFGDTAKRDNVVLRLADAVALWSVGLAMAHPVDVDARYEDAVGKRVRIADVLIALHHDPRIRAGMTVEQIRPVARVIAEDMDAAPSWGDWLKAHRPVR